LWNLEFKKILERSRGIIRKGNVTLEEEEERELREVVGRVDIDQSTI
jgi:hypothetical protein